jgi:hypothetical protein
MNEIKYMGYTFFPYGNIIGRDAETRLQRLDSRMNTLTPLLNKADGYDYENFNKATADIYYCPQRNIYYVPVSSGLYYIDVADMLKRTKVLESENLMDTDNRSYSLAAMKKVLGDDYKFHQSKTIDEVKKILETGDFPDKNTIPFALQVGNLDIKVIINRFNMAVFSEDGVITEPRSLEYFCRIRKDGKLEGFEEIPALVNLDVPDLEAEMFSVLDSFATTRGLSFFASNEDMNCYEEPHVNEDEIEM